MIDYAIVGIYLAAVLLIGLYYGFRVKTVSDYAVAGRNYPTPIIVATVFATLIGGASTIGVAQQFFSVGVIFFVVCLGAVFRDLITAKWIVPRMGDLTGLISPGDMMGQYFGRPGQVITGIASVARCAGFIGTQISALGFLGSYFLGLPYSTCAIVATLIVVMYSSFGGIRSVTITDIIQFGVLVVAIPMICNFGASAAGGQHALMDALPDMHKTFLVDSATASKYLGLAFVFLLPDLDPAILQRLLMGRNLQQGRTSLIITALASIPLYALAGLIGLIALAIKPDLDSSLALPFLLNNVLPVGIKGIAISGMLAVVMSTADSYLNIGGIALTHDIIRPLRKKKLSDRSELRIMQIGTIGLGVLSAACALALPNIFELAVASLALWKPIILPPMLVGILGLMKSRKLFYAGVASSISVLFVWDLFFKEQSGVDGILVAAIVNFAVLLSPYWLRKSGYLSRKNREAIG